MKKKLMCIFFILCLISLTQTQAYSGDILPHLYTGIAFTELTGQLLRNFTYSYALDRSAFSPGEQVLAATTIRDFSYVNQASAPTFNGYVHIEVANPRISANRKLFQFNLIFVRTQAQTLSFPLRVKHLSICYILVGEFFEGQYDSSDIPSTFIYVKNSGMLTPSKQGKTLVDFNTSSAQSPFLYDPNGPYKGCGASKRQGNWIIQTSNCTIVTATLFVTGFEIVVTSGSNTLTLTSTDLTNEAKIPDILAQVQINLKDTTQASFTTNATKDGIFLKFPVMSGYLYQISMVVVGLVEYTQGVYPIQNTFRNNFDVNTYVQAVTKNVFYPGVETSLYQLSSSFAPKPSYAGYKSSKYGHRICGFYHLGIKGTTDASAFRVVDNTPRKIGFLLATLESNPNFDSVKPTATINHKPATTSALVNSLLSIDAGFSCVFIVADPPCVEKLTPLNITSPKVQITPITVPPVASVTFTSAPSPNPYMGGGDPYMLSPVSIFSQQSTTNAASTIVYSTTVAATDVKIRAYEGVLHLTYPRLVAAVKYTLKIEVFGNVVVDHVGQFPISSPQFNQFKYFHFGFQNNNPKNNTIFITFNFFTGKSGLSSQSIEFAIFSHDKVISTDQTCAASCATEDGNSMGIDFKSVPPMCITCDRNLNLVFNPLTGSCSCASGYYAGVDGCQPCTVTLCGVCTADATNCAQCTANSHFQNNADPKQGCICNNGFYRSSNICLACTPGCANCSNIVGQLNSEKTWLS